MPCKKAVKYYFYKVMNSCNNKTKNISSYFILLVVNLPLNRSSRRQTIKNLSCLYAPFSNEVFKLNKLLIFTLLKLFSQQYLNLLKGVRFLANYIFNIR